jgi:hypothetical protein
MRSADAEPKNKRDSNARAAGVLYLILGVFAAGALGIWLLTPPRQAIEGLGTTPGAVALLLTITCLLLSSLGLGGYLTARRRASKIVLILSGLTACVGFAWNIIAVVFWLVPAFFVWRAYRLKDNQ